MSASHHHGGQSTARVHRWRLAVAFGLVVAFFAVELVAGLASGSLALISDAGHMAADVVALGAALVATRVATRRDSTGMRTFGSYRAEVFASGLSVLLMLGVGGYIAAEAANRIGKSAEPASSAMLIVGTLGLLVNLVALGLLRGGSTESINVKGAYLEVVADTVGSAGVILAGVLVAWSGNSLWDTGIAIIIATFVVVRAVLLGREVLAVLGQHAPSGVVPNDVRAALAAVPGVIDVHDLHVWTLTTGMNVATAHLMTQADADAHAVLDAARDVMERRFDLPHATVQVEPDTHTGCRNVAW